MGKYLTTSQKDNLKPYLLKRDGANCFYCNEPFDGLSKEKKLTFDHLDNNPKNNQSENLVLAHFRCNQLKKSYPEFQIMAENKLKENHSSFDSEVEGVNERLARTATNKEIDIHVAFAKLTNEYLTERLIAQGKPALDYNGTAESIAYLMWERTGHGSPATAKRHLGMFTSSAAPFKKIDENGETVIIKRT